MHRVIGSIALVALLCGFAGAALAAKPAAPRGRVPGPPLLSDARAWIVIDAGDGAVLAARGEERRLPIASTTKLMTAYLALKRLKPGQILRAPRYDAEGAESLLGLRVGEPISVRDLLYALVLQSANDAAETLADGVAGSEAAFVKRMNAHARRLGLAHTHYSTPVGLDEPGNYSSAHDLVTLADALLQNPLFAKIADSSNATLTSGDRVRHIVTRNMLLDDESFITGVKTGHTLDAGWVLVGSRRCSGRRARTRATPIPWRCCATASPSTRPRPRSAKAKSSPPPRSSTAAASSRSRPPRPSRSRSAATSGS